MIWSNDRSDDGISHRLDAMTAGTADPSGTLPALLGGVDLERHPGRSKPVPHFIADHLAWWEPTNHPGAWCRIARLPSGGARVFAGPGIRIAGPSEAEPDRWDTIRLPLIAFDLLPPDLRRRLTSRGPLLRIATPTVWEATATAVIRQVVHRDQARAAFGRLCERFGVPFLVGGQIRHAMPSPEQVLSQSDQALRSLGIGFKARTLRTLAEWCLDSRDHLGAQELHDALLAVRGIGPWTASVAVCDRFSDFSFYPIDDLAVRAHARALWTGRAWPAAPKLFARAWSEATEPYTAELTAFLMAEAILSDA